jgi:UPF0716 family protein affecting phage T7 exclusion
VIDLYTTFAVWVVAREIIMLMQIVFAVFGFFAGYVIARQSGNSFWERVKNYFNLRHSD